MIQRNAITSWRKLAPAVDVVLLGNEDGCAQAAADLGVGHVPEVGRNEYGTPLLSDVFKIAESTARTEFVAFVNSDIMLTGRFLNAVEKTSARWSKFLLVGRRINVDLKEPWDFGIPDWEGRLEEFARSRGTLFAPDAIDYFVFQRRMWGEIPPFTLGRAGFDNWLIFRARQLRLPVVDATGAVLALHQNHDYAHHPEGKAGVWEGPEARRNLELAGGWDHVFDLNDATWKIAPAGPKRAFESDRLWRRFRRIPVLHTQAYRLIRPFVYILNFGRRLIRKFLHPVAGLMGRRG